MKKLVFNVFLACLVLVIIQACKKDEDNPTPILITAEDFTVSIAENPANAEVIGTVSASISDGSALTYTLSNENVSGALTIDANTGELSVADASAFDFESNPSITASYTASNGTIEATANIMVTITDNALETAFITTWETTTNNESITIPTNLRYTYNYTVDWGDGNTTTETGNATHTYANAGEYQVAILGTFPTITFYSEFNSDELNDELALFAEKVKSIDQWGNIVWQSMEGAFANCINLTYNATDTPNLENVTTLNSMFRVAESFNGDISTWDVSNVTDMNSMFFSAIAFNQDISSWDVSNVTNMEAMFFRANAFNQNIASWNVSNVTDMSGMFSNAEIFNQDISSWNVSNVTDMESMFRDADAFNQDLNTWNVSNVMNMQSMFSRCLSFNGNIANWDVSSVSTMRFMFNDATAFNQDLNTWNVSNVTDMASMFNDATAFNGNIGNWDVSNVTNMSGMFQSASAFNDNIGNWDVSNVTIMASMFDDATAFNGNISTWNVSNVTNMTGMFQSASSFNQNISTWNVSSATNMSRMFHSASAFNQNLRGWNTSNVTQCFAFALFTSIQGTSKIPNMGPCFLP